ncbi:MAG: pilus assembly protein TadG-related protein [Kineosporiaceae bacterium]
MRGTLRIGCRCFGRDGRVGRHDRDDRGAATAFVVAVTGALLLTAGLVIDGGQALNGRARVADDAEQAARAAADRIDVTALRSTGEVRLRPDAGGAAAALLASRGYGGGQYAVSVGGASATVTVTDTVPTAFLLLVGYREFTVRASATAEATTP